LSVNAQAWITQQSNTFSNLWDVQFLNSKLGFAVGSEGVILKTIDGGNNWKIKPSGTIKTLVSVCFLDSLTGFVISNTELFKTNDGGASWFLQDTVNNGLTNIQFVSQDTGYIAGIGKFLMTSDRGDNWIKHMGTPYIAVNSFYATDFKTLYLGGADFLILKSVDGGENWFVSHNNTSYGAFESLFFTSKNVGYAAGGSFAQGFFYGIISKTTDGGLNWSSSWHSSSTLGGNGISAVYFANENIGYAASNGGDLIKTTDAGSNWINLESGNNQSLKAIFFTDLITGYAVGANGTILKTTTGGENWDYIDNSKTISVKFFPNPVLDYLTIETELINPGVELSVYDISGLKLITQQITTSKMLIDLSLLKSGVYFVKITRNETVETFKIIKQ
jgi:photosystem II stability/assembly factor-like uncharacterized protein